VANAGPVSQGKRKDFLEKERQLLSSRREKLNSKQLKGYLPPALNQTPGKAKTQEGVNFAN